MAKAKAAGEEEKTAKRKRRQSGWPAEMASQPAGYPAAAWQPDGILKAEETSHYRES